MTQEDLNLYRNTYNAGMRNGILEFAERIKEDIFLYHADCDLGEDDPNCIQCCNNIFGSIERIINKHLKEALDETGRSNQT